MSQEFRMDFRETPFLETSRTGSYLNRLNWRAEVLLTRNSEMIRDKRILDLASHDGRFSYACLKLGAHHVTGFEGRSHLVSHARRNLESLGIGPERFDFRHGDVFDLLPSCAPGRFETILCFGFLYHTSRQIELSREIRRLHPQHLIVDTSVVEEYLDDPLVKVVLRFRDFLRSLSSSDAFRRWRLARRNPPRLFGALIFTEEDSDREGATIDASRLVAFPTPRFVEAFIRDCGLQSRELPWPRKEVGDWHALRDYEQGSRVSYVGS